MTRSILNIVKNSVISSSTFLDMSCCILYIVKNSVNSVTSLTASALIKFSRIYVLCISSLAFISDAISNILK